MSSDKRYVGWKQEVTRRCSSNMSHNKRGKKDIFASSKRLSLLTEVWRRDKDVHGLQGCRSLRRKMATKETFNQMHSHCFAVFWRVRLPFKLPALPKSIVNVANALVLWCGLVCSADVLSSAEPAVSPLWPSANSKELRRSLLFVAIVQDSQVPLHSFSVLDVFVMKRSAPTTGASEER